MFVEDSANFLRRRERNAAAINANPPIIIVQVEGSGMAPVARKSSRPSVPVTGKIPPTGLGKASANEWYNRTVVVFANAALTSPMPVVRAAGEAEKKASVQPPPAGRKKASVE